MRKKSMPTLRNFRAANLGFLLRYCSESGRQIGTDEAREIYRQEGENGWEMLHDIYMCHQKQRKKMEEIQPIYSGVNYIHT